MNKKDIFTAITSCEFPPRVPSSPKNSRNEAFSITVVADGLIPFSQVILRDGSKEYLVKGDMIRPEKNGRYVASVPEGMLPAGHYFLQAEGCRQGEISRAAPGDWVKWFGELTVESTIVLPRARTMGAASVKLYFGIHKHMHQPYYQAANPAYWDGQKDEIFGSRHGPYTGFVPAAVGQYIRGGLPHAGLSTSWSGSLIEQLDRCGRDGLCGGRFAGWKDGLARLAQEKTVLGNRRVEFSAFGFFHPLMPLIPARDIVKQIELHRRVIRDMFGVEPSTTLFPRKRRSMSG